MRTTDIKLIEEGIGDYREEIINLDLPEWVSNPDNIALTNDAGDIAMFERQHRLPITVAGHYFFKSRGKAAVASAKEFLEEIFTGPYEVGVVIGLTPLDNRPALWMNTKLKFKTYGELETDAGPCRFVVLSKHEWAEENI